MGIPFITMDASNVVNSMVNDAVGIPPAAPEPSGPIDITDQCTSSGYCFGNGGVLTVYIPADYIGYYIEVVSNWPSDPLFPIEITSATGWNVDNRSDVIDDTNITTKGIIPDRYSQSSGVGIQTSGNHITINPTLVSVIVSETEF